MDSSTPRKHVVIVGGGFGGLYAAKSLAGKNVDVTLIDRRNHHLFQPLLYQVATGGVSPGDIASPLRSVLSSHDNIRVWQAEAKRIDPANKRVVLDDGDIDYDFLVLATGASHQYFDHPEWASHAPGLKSIEDALEIRRRVFLAFEAAERESVDENRRAWMTFVIIGAGPTGVELAGALAELAHFTLVRDFRRIDTRTTRIVLVEGTERILPSFPEDLSRSAARSLEKLGVTLRTGCFVTDISDAGVSLESAGAAERLDARTVLWAAGVAASGLGRQLAPETGADLDRAGRIVVRPDLTVPGDDSIYVIGDLAAFLHHGDKPLPGTAPVAMQQGRHAARSIVDRISGRPPSPFRYKDKGSLAVIGRHAAVAAFARLNLSGYPAWLAWVFVHIWYLIEFDNKLIVMIQWAFDYFTRKRGARLITGQTSWRDAEEP